ncbi:hypothetical protein ABGB08_49170 [Acrocarpospora sp. B8E8]
MRITDAALGDESVMLTAHRSPIRALAVVDVAETLTLVSAGDEGLQAVTFPTPFSG